MSEVKSKGFARVPAERLKEISRMGGKAAHAQGKAHRWTAEQAQEAGRKGGAATAAKRTDPSRSPDLEAAKRNGSRGGMATKAQREAVAGEVPTPAVVVEEEP